MTNSPPAALLGDQHPRVRSAPPAVSSSGAEAAELAETAGLILDPWQRLSLDVMLGERADGKWSAFEFGELVARQNGKGGVLEARELAGLFLFGERLLLHTAHEFKTAQEAFLRVKALVDNTDDLRKKVARIRTSHGEEGIELLGRYGGHRLRFLARSRSSGRGFTGDLLVFDEAQELPETAVGAALFALSARPNPQVIYTGTVPSPENDAEHWTKVRDRGRAGDDPSLGWMEWSAGERLDDLDDRGAWARANPALGIRITEETIERERNALGDDTFARERLSLWSPQAHRTVVDLAVWTSLADPNPPQVTAPAFAIDVTPDRSRASVAFAGFRPDARRHVEVIANERGTGWVVAEVVALLDSHPDAVVVLDVGGPAGSLLKPLEDAGVEPMVISAAEMAQACGGFYDAVVADPPDLSHFDQPALNAALGAARKRPLRDAWAWHRRDVTDISPLVAVTLALFGLSHPPEPKRKRSGKVW